MVTKATKALLLALALSTGTASALEKPKPPTPTTVHHVQKKVWKMPKPHFVSKLLNLTYFHRRLTQGQASWYGTIFQGARTASGAIFDTNKFTCAHLTLPFGTRVLVRNISNGLSAICTVNDRGPYVARRIIDLSHAMKVALRMGGTAPVELFIAH